MAMGLRNSGSTLFFRKCAPSFRSRSEIRFPDCRERSDRDHGRGSPPRQVVPRPVFFHFSKHAGSATLGLEQGIIEQLRPLRRCEPTEVVMATSKVVMALIGAFAVTAAFCVPAAWSQHPH